METAANKHRNASDFAVGQKVWLATNNLPLCISTRKLSSKFAGPYEVVARVTREAYKLALPP